MYIYNTFLHDIGIIIIFGKRAAIEASSLLITQTHPPFRVSVQNIYTLPSHSPGASNNVASQAFQPSSFASSLDYIHIIYTVVHISSFSVYHIASSSSSIISSHLFPVPSYLLFSLLLSSLPACTTATYIYPSPSGAFHPHAYIYTLLLSPLHQSTTAISTTDEMSLALYATLFIHPPSHPVYIFPAIFAIPLCFLLYSTSPLFTI